MTRYIFEGINRTNRRVDAVVKLVRRQETKSFWTSVTLGLMAYEIYRLRKEVNKLAAKKEGE